MFEPSAPLLALRFSYIKIHNQLTSQMFRGRDILKLPVQWVKAVDG